MKKLLTLIILVYSSNFVIAQTYFIKSTEDVNLRSGKSTSTPIQAQVPSNATIVVLNKDGEWWNVEYDGVKGYIRSDLISEKKALKTRDENQVKNNEENDQQKKEMDTTSTNGGLSFYKGQKDLNIGLGLGNTFLNSNYQKSLPPISMSFEYGIEDEISLGAYIAYSKAKWSSPFTSYTYNQAQNYWAPTEYEQTYSYSFYIIGARGVYHFVKFIDNEQLDLYAGLMIGANITSLKITTNDPNPNDPYIPGGTQNRPMTSGLIWSGFAGCRYKLNDKIGIFGELGYGISYLTVGLNVKLN